MHPEPAGDYQIKALPDAVIYYYTPLPRVKDVCVDAYLEPLLWKHHYQPFAVVVVHHSTGNITLIRDHWGLSPLYYTQHQDALIFGPDIPSVLQKLPKKPAWCTTQMRLFFTNSHDERINQTLYEGIYRVPSAHLLTFDQNGAVTQQAFWTLNPHDSLLHYANQKDYFEHFSSLMREALLNATCDQRPVAAEFSAGLDSTAIYCAARDVHLEPRLFMHDALPNTPSARHYDDSYERFFFEHYSLTTAARIGIHGFDPIKIFKEYAAWFAGPAPYLFFMFANPLHQAVVDENYRILLSGFGGDQCVSCPLPTHFFIPELLHQGHYLAAWKALPGSSRIKKAIRYMACAHPILHALQLNIKQQRHHQTHPYDKAYYRSAREAQWSLLQGPLRHEIAMRIEYSSVVSKRMGFEYRYPLLYPKLVEFMLRIPTEINRLDGRGRYLIRHYLSQQMPGSGFDVYRKQTGLGIIPATLDWFTEQYHNGQYQDVLHDALHNKPFSQWIHHPHALTDLINRIKGYMLHIASA